LKKKTALFIIIASLIVFYIGSPVYAESTQASANRAINEAQDSIYVAYKSIAQAEQAGGDVSNLVDQLNNAVTLLEEARGSYEQEDYSAAYEKAVEAKSIAETVEQNADDLQARANFARILQLIVIPLVIVLAVIFSFIFIKRGWKWLERKADEEFLEMEIGIPEEEEE
jgi:vacuolar-type H+-ATPase subunit I/STV1